MKNFGYIPLLVALVTAPVHAHESPRCDALEDGLSMRAGIDANIDFDGDDLRFREDGETVMIITANRELFLRGEQINLDTEGKLLVDRYYTTVDQFVDDALDLAGDAASLGLSAAFGALATVLSGDEGTERFEKRIEARAEGIRQQANSMCERFIVIEEIEKAMQARVPGFVPMMFASHGDD